MPGKLDGFLIEHSNGSSLIVVGIVVASIFAVELFVPVNLSSSIKISIFQSLINVDGVLIGFIGLVFSMFLTRPRQDIKIVRLFPTFILSICFLLASVVSGFIGLLESGESVSRFPALAVGLFTMLGGTAFFFLVVLLTVMARLDRVESPV